jgi:hypothetical protein
MNATLDAGIQLLQVVLLVTLVAQNFAVTTRMRNIEETMRTLIGMARK